MKAIETSYAGYLFRSRQEARHAVFFDALGISYRYEYEGYDLDGIYYLPDFYLPQLDCFIEVKGKEPTAKERTKAKLLALHTGKRVLTFYGDIWIPGDAESYHGICDEPPRIIATKEWGGVYKELTLRLPSDLMEASVALGNEMVELIVGSKSIGFVSTTIGYHGANLADNLQAYVAHLQRQQEMVRKLQPVLLQHEQELQQLMSVGENYHLSLHPQYSRSSVVWSECTQCGKIQPSDAGRKLIRRNASTGEERVVQTALMPIGSWCKCHPGLPTYAMQSPRLLAAYTAARQARFENPHAKVTPLQVPASSQKQPGHSPSSMPSGSGGQAPVLTLVTALEPRLILRQTFTTFNPRVKGVQEAFLAAKEFVAKPGKWLVFTGPHGCGKTHLMMAITYQCLKDGHQVLSFSEPDLLDALRAIFNGSASYRFDDLFSPIQQAAILVLDDVGIQRRTQWVQETMGRLFTYRFEQCLPTVLVIAERQAPDVLPYLQLHQQICHVQMEGVADYRIFQGRLPRKVRRELGPDGR